MKIQKIVLMLLIMCVLAGCEAKEPEETVTSGEPATEITGQEDITTSKSETVLDNDQFAGAITINEAEQNDYVIWRDQQITKNENRWNDFRMTAEQGNDCSIMIASQYYEEDDLLCVKKLVYKDGQYHLIKIQDGNQLTYKYTYLLEITNGEKTYYVLTDYSSLDFRMLYRGMWMKPEDREEPFHLLMVTGGENGTMTTDLNWFPDADQEEILLLDSLDDQPVYSWVCDATSEEQAEAEGYIFTKDNRSTDYSLGPVQEQWISFAETALNQEPCRVRIARQAIDEQTDIYFDGQYFDVISWMNGEPYENLFRYNYTWIQIDFRHIQARVLVTNTKEYNMDSAMVKLLDGYSIDVDEKGTPIYWYDIPMEEEMHKLMLYPGDEASRAEFRKLYEIE